MHATRALPVSVRTVPARSLTRKQPRRGGKQCTDGPELSRFHSSVPSIHETIGGLGHETIVPWLTNWPPPLNQGGLSIKDGTLSGMVNLARAKDMAFGVAETATHLRSVA